MASFLEGAIFAISTYRVQGERLAWEMALKGGFGRQGNPTFEDRGTSRRSCHRSVSRGLVFTRDRSFQGTHVDHLSNVVHIHQHQDSALYRMGHFAALDDSHRSHFSPHLQQNHQFTCREPVCRTRCQLQRCPGRIASNHWPLATQWR